MAIVSIKNLTFGYRSQLIFDRFSWECDESISIIEGPSGCGKTTFLRILAGDLNDFIGADCRVPRPARLILQEDGLLPWLTAEGNLALIPTWPGFRALTSSVEAIAEAVSLYAQQIVGTLSFGQRRLVELLRLFGCPSSLILLDEPLNFLDVTRRRLVVNAIAELAERGSKFVISSHYEADFSNLPCQRYRFEGDMPYHTLTQVPSK